MRALSNWPLTPDAIRILIPEIALSWLENNAQSQSCFPTGTGYYPHADGHKMRRDQHVEHLLFYCTAGQGHLQTDQLYTVNAGDILLLPKGLAHSYASSSERPWTIYWLHFDGSESTGLIERIQSELSQPVFHIGPQPALISDFTRLFGLRDSPFVEDAMIYSASIVRQLLSSLPLLIREKSAELGREQFDIASIQGLMLEHIFDQIDLDQLAASAHLSRYHFSTKYKSLTGYPPIKHFNLMKMQYASQLLDTTDLAVNRVASKLGYDDPLYFSRLFRRTLGMSPSAYRNQRRA